MILLYANPITLVYHHLLLWMFGTPLADLHSQFQIDQMKTLDIDSPTKTMYDFIVVGGGSAGSVVAGRLVEENFTVLLLEAGGYPSPITAVPALAPMNLNHPEIDWRDKTVPQENACLSFMNQANIYNHGKAVGGSSNLNFMVAMRGSPLDFNHWADACGDASWKYDKLLPYFKKMEKYDGSFPLDKFHGNSGPLHITRQDYVPLLKEWLEAGKELGFVKKDPNGELSKSFFPLDTTIYRGTRYSTHRAYTYKALVHKNMDVKLYSHATKIEIDDKKRATGVHYESAKGRKHFAAVSKEVIVSSGAINSPQLLMLSGIGPEEKLKPHGIPVKVKLPVGENLQDHMLTYVGPYTIDNGKGYNVDRDLNFMTLNEYIRAGTGPFSTLGNPSGAMTSSSIAPAGYPDIYLMLLTMTINPNAASGLTHSYGFKPGVLEKYFQPDFGKDAFFIITTVARPKARGRITLKSANPMDRPIINPKFYSHPDDMTVMMDAIKFALKLGETKAFKKVGAKLTTSLWPGCEKHGNASSMAYWECFARHWTQTDWHVCGSNRMGKSTNDPTAVVNSKLKVKSMENLRVVDASIMPRITTCNTNLPTVMIGEKGADLIKDDWKS